jgi:CHAD domain-containing protein
VVAFEPTVNARPAANRTAALLQGRVKRVFRELPGAMAGDEEAVHQVRVAGRRLRVALPLLAVRSRGRRVRRSLAVLRELTRVVGRGRDLDVFLVLLEDHVAAASAATPEQRALLGRLRASRARARRQVAEAVMDLDIDGLRRNLRRVLQQGPADTTTVLARILALREKEGALLLRGFSHVGDRYLPMALHGIRRRARRLRYAAELEDALRGADSRAPLLWRRLQDGIGGVHDTHQLAGWLDAQARAAEGRSNPDLARAARRERRFFLAEGRRRHATLLQARPADLALRALQAMARVRNRPAPLEAAPPAAAAGGARRSAKA